MAPLTHYRMHDPFLALRRNDGSLEMRGLGT